MINRIQKKSCLHNICMSTVYINYVYIRAVQLIQIQFRFRPPAIMKIQ